MGRSDLTPVIRPADPEDAPILGRVHVRAWQAAYRGVMPDAYLDNLSSEERAEMWARSIVRAREASDGRHISVVLSDGAIAGFAASGAEFGGAWESSGSQRVGELYAINLDPDHWGRGLGRLLLKSVIEDLRNDGYDEAVLWVVPDNARAIGLYESEGWRADGSSKVDEVLGVTVSEARYRLAL